MEMKAILVEISFSEALFKVHYTKGFRLTYLIPLPTSVAGMFGALLGVEREEINEMFKNCFFGAKLLSYEGMFQENTTFIQYKGKPVKGVISSTLLNNPTYLIALVAVDDKVKLFRNMLKDRITYFPYGGQNDFFAEEVRLIEVSENVGESSVIENYAPQDFVEKIEFGEGTELQILPVRHKLSPNLNFYFIFKGKLKLKRPILSVRNIGVYPLAMFYYLPTRTRG